MDLGSLRFVVDYMCCPRSLKRCGRAEPFLAEINGAVEELAKIAWEADPEGALTLLEFAFESVREVADLVPEQEEAALKTLFDLSSAHLRACERARPDPIRVARWLALARPMTSDLPLMSFLKMYRPLIGEKGVDEVLRCREAVFGVTT